MKCRLLALLAMLLLSACERGSDEQQIRAAVAELTASIEAFDAGDLERQLHPDFAANRKMTRQEAKRLLLFYRLRQQAVSVKVPSLEVILDPVYTDRATTRASALLTSSDGLIPDEGRFITATGRWLKEDDRWLLQQLDWE
ncbi:hypothetical protein FKG94_18500 [Exilibacterium tricleocarpae]|uniref:Nuclear transport factor 2 family protein n=1 Tax=Exilibacterium tricleocarpae TaxID=2591008 RepID=A0A545T624_9GAMM|nr:hypothetical protein [Exilibacterium tricleocarpae]TQV72680.1 hypothetical protein FKG94_18500 [Exilibacterium tricleocarpae]